ncbi:MAG TPA: ATP-binding cassette domain-containing protein [Candidatus Magasanikbacteria bacterium]|nr:ATP-binding cassette domain-containing protein [Candidatus Magasanikbacteria bacterium]
MIIQNDDKKRIVVENIGKKFDLGKQKKDGLLGSLFGILNRKVEKKEFWALKNVTLDFENGKILGIVGRNGSGKSTLLRLLAGIYLPDEGKLEINGQVLYLAGFSRGLMPKLTMRENIYLICSLLGLNNKEIKERFDEIVDFSELRDYLDTQVFKFSSGMTSRLSFSATIFSITHRQPEIILIDEALEAGADLTFRNKATSKIEELLAGGANIVIVSHNLEFIKKYCHKAVWMDKGVVKKTGDPEEVINAYIKNAI